MNEKHITDYNDLHAEKELNKEVSLHQEMELDKKEDLADSQDDPDREKEAFDEELTKTQRKIYAIRDTIFSIIIWIIMIFVRIKCPGGPIWINLVVLLATLLVIFNIWLLIQKLKMK